MKDWSEAFSALGNPERLRLFLLLVHQDEAGGLCVCELVEALGIPQYRVSKHLGALRRAGLITNVRTGRWAYYSVACSQPAKDLSTFLREALPASKVAAELKQLRESLSLRVNGRCVSEKRRGRGEDA